MSNSFVRDLPVQLNFQDMNMSITSSLSFSFSSIESSSSILSFQSTPRWRPVQRMSSQNWHLLNHRDHCTPQQKLMITEHLWREQQWKIKTFLQKWVKTESDAFANQWWIWLLQEALEQSEVQTARAAAASHDDGDISAAKLIEEFDALVEKLFFSKYESSTSIKKLDYFLTFKIIELTASTWTTLLTQLMSNQQQKWSSYNESKNQQSNQQWVYLITAILCRCHARNTANFLAKTMSVYLHKSSVKQQVLEMLAELEVCDDYKYINWLISSIAENVKKDTSIINSIELYS